MPQRNLAQPTRLGRARPAPTTRFNPIPSWESSGVTEIIVGSAVPDDAQCVAHLVGDTGEPPADLELSRAALTTAGFDGAIGQCLILPRRDAPPRLTVGIGDLATLSSAQARDAAAAFARATNRYERLAIVLPDKIAEPAAIVEAIVQGVLLARYRYDAFKRIPAATALERLTLVTKAKKDAGLAQAIERGRITARATLLARDLANTPPTHLTAAKMAEVATEIGEATGLGVEVFDEEALIELGCGGLLGVNRGSADPPRMIKLTYRPSGDATGHIALVGKGVMYDSGGINLKPTDDMHLAMKLDMSGAAAVLGAMSSLGALDCRTAVTGFLMCTDNMPSGTATKLGDVLSIRGGKTVEVQNTDAEGRLMLADGMVLAGEEGVDAIIDIATLTGACMRTFGTLPAGVFGNNQALVDQLTAAAAHTDETVWQLPLDRRYRKELDSEIADLRNVGGAHAASITAALFLDEFTGGRPWAHIDTAGVMKTDADDSWRSTGALGFGARLLIEVALGFSPVDTH